MCAFRRKRFSDKSMRLQGYDYCRNGKYFITICTKNKIPYFGNIDDGKINLSEPGKIIDKFWNEIPNHFPFVILDEYIIMPDHIHGILIIQHSENNDAGTPKLSVPASANRGNQYWKPNSIGSIINQFKRICTITIKTNGYEFAWQPRYHDRIIQTETQLNIIRRYIIMNPLKWNH